jgi:transposase
MNNRKDVKPSGKNAANRYEKDIVLTVDYHKKNMEIRRLDCATGEERSFRRPTTREGIEAVVADALKEAMLSGGQVVWIMESTTGWARVKDLIGDKVRFLLCNVLRMPREPKAYRKKTDRTDTGRMQREYLNGEMPRAYQTPAANRQLRRLTSLREDLVSRRTQLRNQVSSYLSHETWEPTTGLWSAKGLARLNKLAAAKDGDGLMLRLKLKELEEQAEKLEGVEAAILKVYATCAQAKRLDEVKGIAPVAAVSILSRIGPVQRFGSGESLVALAGLAPGVHSSDDTRRSGRIGGGGTDKWLRHYIMEATIWARNIPRYKEAYERTLKRRGRKIARIVVGRMLLRSIHKMLKDDIAFDPSARAAA